MSAISPSTAARRSRAVWTLLECAARRSGHVQRHAQVTRRSCAGSGAGHVQVFCRSRRRATRRPCAGHGVGSRAGHVQVTA
eukprot:2823553-Prymnesium_polylepis.1